MRTLNKDSGNMIPSVNGTDDREARSKFWIAAYTRPRSERKLAQELSKLGIETYVPIQSQLRQWSDRKKKIDVMIIPMIVFAHITETDVATIRARPHALRILTYPGQKKPAIIPDKQIEQLKFILKHADSDVEFVTNVYVKDEPVEVVRGNLMGLTGQVERTSDGKANLIVIIEILGGAKVSLSASDIKPLK